MLGCHDFCGYYEWTFHYVRRRFGEEGLQRYWREAIASDSQRHYLEAARQKGLRGLYECWETTGESEQCDWTVSLDEAEDNLRLDMRGCPSKGFLLEHDLNADEDYCDHCIGWIGPALENVGLEVIVHEHNHCGQCSWQIGRQGADAPAEASPADIRRREEWQHGYLHRFERHHPAEAAEANSAIDSIATIEKACADSERLLLIGSDFDAAVHAQTLEPKIPSVCVAQVYAALINNGHRPRIVVASSLGTDWGEFGIAWNRVVAAQRPLLVHDFLPGESHPAWSSYCLPRPLPLLPTLIRAGHYAHEPGRPTPTADQWALLLGAALEKQCVAIGVEAS